MGYTALQVPFRKSKFRIPQEIPATTFMAKSGQNLRDLPQLLSIDFALKIVNYNITTDGGLSKRKGLKKIFEIAGNKPTTLLSDWLNDYWVYAYNDKLSVYQISTGTSIIVKTYTAKSTVEGEPYGDYFYTTNALEVPGFLSIKLEWSVKTVDFANGQIVTGATSGATGVILEGGGISPYLIIGNVKGTFQTGELITDPLGGSATVLMPQTFFYRDVPNAPRCKTLKIQSSRLFLGNLVDSDRAAVNYSNLDTGTLGLPPFGAFATGTAATQPGLITYKRAGGVNSISSIGNINTVFSDMGKWAFTIDTFQPSNLLLKKDTPIIDRTDFGGARGALNCAKGSFYVNEAGLWQLVSLGQPNIPFSDQEGLNSVLLGSTYFDDVDLTNASLVYDAQLNTLYLACAKNSTINNLVIGYNLENKAFFEIKGWNINRFMSVNQTIYGCSANQTKVWQCFEGYSDDGKDIWTEYYQELKTGDLETRQMLLGQYVQGFLSLSTVLDVRFDIYDVQGNFMKDKLQFEWTVQSGENLSDGYGVASWGTAAIGGDIAVNNNLVESFDGARGYIRNYQRIRVRITGHDQVPHAVNWVKLLAEPKVPIRRRKLVQIT